jgi:hypothetical protein
MWRKGSELINWFSYLLGFALWSSIYDLKGVQLVNCSARVWAVGVPEAPKKGLKLCVSVFPGEEKGICPQGDKEPSLTWPIAPSTLEVKRKCVLYVAWPIVSL